MTGLVPQAKARQPVAQYLRMSTEHQQYSTENQSLLILQYAQSHNMEIVRTYADHGKSGLNLSGRPSIRRLLDDVKAGNVDFSAILVYDVSRWGRFQNPDQAASYEYALTAANAPVHYCAEEFANDGSLSSSLLKTIKRGMAGEYSRELSVKVWAGQKRLVELGFRQGGVAGYGLRRHLLDQHGTFKQVLCAGDRKSLQTDRVILVPGPAEELEVVQQIYRMFITNLLSEVQIASQLNSSGTPWEDEKPWTRSAVNSILTNHKYIGGNVYNRNSFKLKREFVRNAPEDWVHRPKTFEAVVHEKQFDRAREILNSRKRRVSTETLIEKLASLYAEVGYLSDELITNAKDMPASRTYMARFGSLTNAYALVGFIPRRRYHYLELNRAIKKRHSIFLNRTQQDLIAAGASVTVGQRKSLLTINEEFTVDLTFARCFTTPNGLDRWVVRPKNVSIADLTLVVRLTRENDAILDYFIFPDGVAGTWLLLKPENPVAIELYRFDDLTFFTNLVRRSRIEEAA